MSTLFSVEEIMKKEEHNKLVNELKKEINSRLKSADASGIGEMILWLIQHQYYQYIKQYDEQFARLECFIDIWRQEKRKSHLFEMQGDIFYQVRTLKELDEKYCLAQFAILRVEMDLPYECVESQLMKLRNHKFSAYALLKIAECCTRDYRKNIQKIARIYKNNNEMVIAIGLLQLGIEMVPDNSEILLEMADIWISVQQYRKAYENLSMILNPNEEIQELKKELEKII